MQGYDAFVPNSSSQTVRIGARLRAARDALGLTQKDLADRLRIENRQTLASIEAGSRKLSAEELLDAVRILGVDLDYFTDGFRLIGEGRFSFRAQPGVSASILDEFEGRAGRWIATYRELGAQQGETPSFVGLKLELDQRSTFEQAQSAAESLLERWRLMGKGAEAVPAKTLPEAMEQHLGALILYVDAPPGISGAASQVPGLNTVLVNWREPEGRRNYDVAHELFHLLTWDTMPPDRVEAIEVKRGGKGNRVEQLAENFAAALLMPADALRSRWERRDAHSDVHSQLRNCAAEFRVSAVACKWRLFNLELLDKADLLDIDDRRISGAPAASGDDTIPRRFGAPFVRRIATALDDGRLSAKRSASLLGLSLSELADLLREYEIEPSFEA